MLTAHRFVQRVVKRRPTLPSLAAENFTAGWLHWSHVARQAALQTLRCEKAFPSRILLSPSVSLAKAPTASHRLPRPFWKRVCGEMSKEGAAVLVNCVIRGILGPSSGCLGALRLVGPFGCVERPFWTSRRVYCQSPVITATQQASHLGLPRVCRPGVLHGPVHLQIGGASHLERTCRLSSRVFFRPPMISST